MVDDKVLSRLLIREGMFRRLRAEEIDVRVGAVAQSGASLLLYKDARCDQNILDETVGPFNWQRHHSRNNANCIVSIWDQTKGQWVEKEDTGTESNTESEKGLASDSFKRACFNWGIGRELYTAPFIFVKAQTEQYGKGWKLTKQEQRRIASAKVDAIEYEDGKVSHLVISNRDGVLFSYGESRDNMPVTRDQAAELERLVKEARVKPESVWKAYGARKVSEMRTADYKAAKARLLDMIGDKVTMVAPDVEAKLP